MRRVCAMLIAHKAMVSGQFTLHSSHRMEALAQALAQNISSMPLGPFEQETVVVQSRGMEQWLKLQLAEHNAIVMNITMPFPTAAILPIAEMMGISNKQRWLDPAATCWKLFTILESVDEPDMEILAQYLSARSEPLARYQLAARLAQLFDRYLIFRPKMIQRWNRGNAEPDERWQARLWQELCETLDEPPSVIDPHARPAPHPELPGRITLFGLSHLPPILLDVLRAYSQFGEVHLYTLQPTPHFWDDLLSPKALNRELLKQTSKPAPDDHFLNTGNPLLTNLGKHGRDFLKILRDRDPVEEFIGDSPAPDSLLHHLQADIFNAEAQPADSLNTLAPDQSLTVSSCHSAKREVECLHNFILQTLHDDESLKANDILVLCPDINHYAPYIEAVFNGQRASECQLPIQICDRQARNQSHLFHAWMALLELARSRFSAEDVMNLLAQPTIQQRFEFGSDDLNLFQTWIQQARIRWGWNAQHLSTLSHPDLPKHHATWREGLDRLLLGAAMLTEHPTLCGERLPTGNTEGEIAQLLGRFTQALETIAAHTLPLALPMTMSQWDNALTQLADMLLEKHEHTGRDAQVLRNAIDSLRQQIDTCGNTLIPLAVIETALNESLNQLHNAENFTSGAITFCALKPMRAIPAKIVCMLGLNDDSFPRPNRPLSFDLMELSPQPGDQAARTDDRFLFLESLLSARDKLYLSHIGFNEQNGKSRPSSPLIADLLSYLDQYYRFEHNAESRPPSSLIKQHHRLHGYHRHYFDNTLPRSFSPAELHTAQALYTQQAETTTAANEIPTLNITPETHQLQLSELAHFFINPAQYFLRHTLNTHLQRPGKPLENHETLYLNGRARYEAINTLLSTPLSPEAQHSTLAELDTLPAGNLGQAAFTQYTQEAQEFSQRINAITEGFTQTDLKLYANCLDYELHDTLNTFTSDNGTRLIHTHYGRRKGKHMLALWLQLLLTQKTHPDASAYLITRDTITHYAPPPELAQSHLDTLLKLYLDGLSQPLPFLAESSLIAAEKTNNPLAALTAWTSNYPPGDAADQAFLQFYAPDVLATAPFLDCAQAVYAPILEYGKELQ